MAGPARGRARRRRRLWRRLWRRRALPVSRRALALGALAAVGVLVLLLIGLTRTGPSRDVPPFDPTTTTRVPASLPPPSITARTVAVVPPAPPAEPTPTTRQR